MGRWPKCFGVERVRVMLFWATAIVEEDVLAGTSMSKCADACECAVGVKNNM